MLHNLFVAMLCALVAFPTISSGQEKPAFNTLFSALRMAAESKDIPKLKMLVIFGKVIRSFKSKDVFVMDYQEARMILLQGKDGLQLFFWENLNDLLRRPPPEG